MPHFQQPSRRDAPMPIPAVTPGPVAPPPGHTRPELAGRALFHVACETLALGCLFERRGDVYIRIPVHRRQQTEGCEWHCRRAGGRLLGVSYTVETLDDWLALAREDPGQVAPLYRAILGRQDIPAADLTWRADVYARTPDGYVPAFAAGSYNPLNAWNTVRGAVHLNGKSQPGFDAAPQAERARLRLANGVPDRGLLFLGGRDRTKDVLRATRRDGPWAPPRRLEAAAPAGATWSLDDLTLPNGEPFTPLGLFRALLGGGAGGHPSRAETLPARRATWRGALPFLPGGLVTEALLRQARLTPMGGVLA